jgi:hypothetical protein
MSRRDITDGKAITPSSTQDLGFECVGLLGVTAGNVHVTTYYGNDLTFPIAAGQQLELAIRRVWADSTASVIGLYEVE